MTDSTDHVTGKTGLTVTVTISKDGGAFGSLGGSVAEVSSGWYKVAYNTTDTNTLGDLAYHATATGADNTDGVDQVVALLPGDNVTVGTNNDKTGYSLTQTFPTNFSSLSIDGSGRVDVIKINSVSASSVTTINANIGTTQPINFTGTAGSALVKGDAIDINSVSASAVTTINANVGTTQPVNFTGTGATAYVKSDVIDVNGTAQTARDLGANLDTTVSSRLATSGYTTPPTSAAIATTLWQDLTTGSDFATANSIGKLLVTDIDAAISSRSTYAGGAVASVTGNVGGNVVGNVNGNVAGSVASVTGNVGGNVVGSVASVTADCGITQAGADKVWDTVLSGHLTTGSTGKALNSASSGGDPWITALPGSYGAGTAGNIVGNNLNATVASRSTYAGADTPGTSTLLGRIPSILSIISGKVDVNDKTGFAPTAAQNAGAIWDEPLAPHLLPGSTGLELSEAASLTDLWTVPLPGSYPSGSAGAIVGRFNIPPPDTPLTVIPAPPTDLSLCRVFAYVETLDNQPAINVPIKFTLAQPDPARSDRLISGRTILANTKADGSLTVDLQRNDHLTPSGSMYLVTCPQLQLQNQEITLAADVFDLSSVIP